jgi:hypothetical protein
MTEQEFAALTEGESVRVDGVGVGTISYFTEYGAGVEFDDGETLNFEYPKLERVSA